MNCVHLEWIASLQIHCVFTAMGYLRLYSHCLEEIDQFQQNVSVFIYVLIGHWVMLDFRDNFFSQIFDGS